MVKKRKPVLSRVKRPAQINFLSYIADSQGCGTIRVMYPFLLLPHSSNKDTQFSTQFQSQYISSPNHYKGYTFAQFQRSATKEHLSLFLHFKKEIQSKFKVPLIYEIDDMLINIPDFNYASLYYKDNEENVKRMLGMANGVITSTEKLKEVYSEYNQKIEVIPNHLPKFVWGDIFPVHEYKNEKEKIKILWAGSMNHFPLPEMRKAGIEGGDLGNKLIEFIRKTTDKYDWIFMGANPRNLDLQIKTGKIKFIKWANIFQYPSVVKALEPDICIAPLFPDEFNECKSNIKCLEYSALGSPGVYTDIRPYKDMTLLANIDEEMISHIEKLAGDINYRAEIWEKDYNKVEPNLFWEENGNLKKYVNSYLKLFGKRL